MKDDTTVTVGRGSVSEWSRRARENEGYPAYIGMDVHKDMIAVSVARSGRVAPEPWGEISNRRSAIAKLVARLSQEFDGEVLLFCYEAGPCGYGLHRQLLELGQDCQVVAPSLIPRKPGDPCIHYVYKEPKDIPAKYYEYVGMKKSK